MIINVLHVFKIRIVRKINIAFNQTIRIILAKNTPVSRAVKMAALNGEKMIRNVRVRRENTFIAVQQVHQGQQNVKLGGHGCANPVVGKMLIVRPDINVLVMETVVQKGVGNVKNVQQGRIGLQQGAIASNVWDVKG